MLNARAWLKASIPPMSNVRLPDGKSRLTFCNPLLLSGKAYVKSCAVIEGEEIPSFEFVTVILVDKYVGYFTL